MPRGRRPHQTKIEVIRKESVRSGKTLRGHLETDMQPKFNLTATLHAKPEKRADLLKLLTSFVGKSRCEQGCVDYHFHVNLDDPNMFYFSENWAERADFDRHIALGYQKDWFARQGDYLAKPVELRFFEMLSSYDK
jgi:quinol monooxygenase YgiN